MLGRLEAHGIPPEPVPSPEAAPPLLIPLHLSKDAIDLRLVTTITTFGTPQDAFVQELRIETFFAADQATERRVRELHDAGLL